MIADLRGKFDYSITLYLIMMMKNDYSNAYYFRETKICVERILS